ncbi:hypothetical protein C7S15_1771 [Burkholderia cepacia]|nr:hypothetical protein [Burkholderia cepacia]
MEVHRHCEQLPNGELSRSIAQFSSLLPHRRRRHQQSSCERITEPFFSVGRVHFGRVNDRTRPSQQRMAKLMSDSDTPSRGRMYRIHDNKSTDRFIVREGSAYPWRKTALKYS